MVRGPDDLLNTDSGDLSLLLRRIAELARRSIEEKFAEVRNNISLPEYDRARRTGRLARLLKTWAPTRRGIPIHGVRRDDGSPVDDEEEVLAAVQAHWSGVFSHKHIDVRGAGNFLERFSRRFPEVDWHVTFDVFCECVRRTSDSSCGPDGLPYSARKHSGDSVLKVVYDGDLLADPTTGIRNPDNMTISADGFAYLQEDRANGGGTDISAGNFGTQEASIWQLEIDPITGESIDDPTRWAQIDRTSVPTASGQTQPAFTSPDSNGVGNWESSGIIDVSAMYDSSAGSYFLANVQAHSLKDGNIGGSGYLVEGGQIDLIQQTI